MLNISINRTSVKLRLFFYGEFTTLNICNLEI